MTILRHLLFSSVLLLTTFSLPSFVAAQTTEPLNSKLPAVPAKVLDDTSVPAGWRRYQMREQPAFSVIFPAPPEALAERGEAGAITHIYTATSKSAVYVGAHFSGLEGTTNPHRQEAFFNSFVTGFVKGVQETLAKGNLDFPLQLTGAKKITISSAQSGFQQDMKLGPFTGQAQVIFAGDTGFAVLSLWTEKAAPAEYEGFFKSFRVTPK